jgi:hypothetical protein
MAKWQEYTTNETVGGAPTNWAWQVAGTGGTASVVGDDGAISGKAWKFSNTVSNTKRIGWTLPGSQAWGQPIEFLMHFKYTTTGYTYLSFGHSASKRGVELEIVGSGSSGSFTDAGIAKNNLNADNQNLGTNTWLWVKVQVDADKTFRCKVWRNNQSEPATWSGNFIIQSALGGYFGFSPWAASSDFYVDYVSMSVGDFAAATPVWWTDWSEYPVDVQPSDWTVRNGAGQFTALVKDKAGIGRCLEINGTVSNFHVLTWNDIGVAADAEIYLKYRSASTNRDAYGIARWTTTPGVVTGYRCMHNSNNYFEITRYVSGTPSSLGTAVLSFASNTVYHARFRFIGNALKGKLWVDGSAEPGTWDLTVTDASVLVSGYFGLGSWWVGTTEFLTFSAALCGLTAPTVNPNPPSADTTAPIISITSVDRYKISDETGLTRSTVVFQVNEAIQAWEIRQGGAGVGQGTLLESGAAADANADITASIDWNELTGGDGTYQVNVYAQDMAGNWTPYNDMR